LIFTVVVLIAI